MRGNDLTDGDQCLSIFGIGRAHAIAGVRIRLGQFDCHA